MKGKSRSAYLIVVVATCMLSLFVLYRTQALNGFARIYGDEFDTVIQSILISHWYGVFRSLQTLNDPLYFFPHPDVLGYNDSYFLNGVVASLFRAIGFDLLTSNELCLLVFKAVGFFSMVFFLRLIHVRKITALCGATLFTLSINSMLQSGHGQLFCVAFAPLLASLLLLLAESIKDQQRIKSIVLGALFAITFNAVMMSGFYMAWFFGLSTLIYTGCLFLCNFEEAKTIAKAAWSRKQILLLCIIIFFASTAPFLYVYLPTFWQTGGQSYYTQLLYSLETKDILNTGGNSLIWNKIFEWSQKTFRGGEYRVGFTPDVLIAFVAAAIAAFSIKNTPRSYIALIVATLICLILPISIHNHSLWFFVSHLVPGASGMRVIARFYIYLAFPVAAIIAVSASRLITSKPRTFGAVTTLFLLLCISQIDANPGIDLDVRKQISLLDRVPPPPVGCKSFFIQNTPIATSPIEQQYAPNVRAMLIADKYGLPTLNGIATFLPPDNVFDTSPFYQSLVGRYVYAYRLHDVCAYDMRSNVWITAKSVDYQWTPPEIMLGHKYSLSQGQDNSLLLIGWAKPEDWGVWTESDQAILAVKLPERPKYSLQMTVISHALLSEKHRHVRVDVDVNGAPAGVLNYDYSAAISDSRQVVQISTSALPQDGSPLIVSFHIQSPATPASLGMNSDSRKLGIAVTSVEFKGTKG